MAESGDKRITDKDIVGLKYFDQLGEKLVPIAAGKRLKDIQQTLTLVDGSIVEALPRIAMASFRDAQSGNGKLMKCTPSSSAEPFSERHQGPGV